MDGYIRAAAATPEIRVADPEYNARQALALARRAAGEGVELLCLPELCLTGYTCGDLFLQDTLLAAAADALIWLVGECAPLGLLVAAGFPYANGNKLYNTAAVFCGGRLLGLVPKTNIPNYGEFYELRHFTPFSGPTQIVRLGGGESANRRMSEKGGCGRFFDVPFGTDLLFAASDVPGFSLAIELCEDLWVPVPPSARHAAAGATVIANLSASDETVGKAPYRRSLAEGQSARLICGYLYADAGYGESTTDMVFAGHNLVCENGLTLAEAAPFGDGWAAADIDLAALAHDRRRMNTYPTAEAAGVINAAGGVGTAGYLTVAFSFGGVHKGVAHGGAPEGGADCGGGGDVLGHADADCGGGDAPDVNSRRRLLRLVDPRPFVPKDERERGARCEEILAMQVAGLAKRVSHTACKQAVVGISGGLDSCLALLVIARAFQKLGRALTDALAVTMPCFGTTSRTKANAYRLCDALGVTCREIDITETVRSHLKDIGHPESDHTVAYENAQARVRTLVLMDLANRSDGIVVGTGDLSELALGWATYNGDHMSMYGVNAGVPKTLVRHIVRHVADTCGSAPLTDVLLDILATPVSPELLPPKDGVISQQTEELVGPYELHDFFLYHTLRWGRSPARTFALARIAFTGVYPEETIKKWLRVFYTRFFSQQFKRSCLPDGPKIGSVTLSPRGDWRMPSDAVCGAWLKEVEKL
ncbi:MAG: NAD(+) synthase [Clostridiales bacterium]|jgi:NAD+ synthase (glutamine-hydrolysing)|nr:NAD(+) synthase [Clostridiales bacterium]